VFRDEPNDKNSQKGQETGNFTDRLDHPDPVAVQSGHFDGKIVEQGRPCL
jgi:hypothetical protein